MKTPSSPTNQFPFRQQQKAASSAHHNRNPSNSSFNSESIGQMSVAPTIASVDTIKISNIQHQQQETLEQKLHRARGNNNTNHTTDHDHQIKNAGNNGGSNSTWKKIKQLVGSSSSKVKIKRTKSDEGITPAATNTNTSRGAFNKTNKPHISSSRTEAGYPQTPPRSHSVLSNDGKRQHQQHHSPIPLRRRVNTMDYPSTTNSNKHKFKSARNIHPQALLDEAVRGRLDGIDVLCLGPAYQISLKRQHPTTETTIISSTTPWEPAPSYSFAGRSTDATTKDIVDDMLWKSAGHQTPELVLEGFFRDDRWIVKLDIERPSPYQQHHDEHKKRGTKQQSTELDEQQPIDSPNTITSKSPKRESETSIPPLQLADDGDSATTATASTGATQEDHQLLPRHKLWNSMWGSDNPPPLKPSHMSSVDDVGNIGEFLDMAASCSVPIDVDEDTFIICNPQHLQAVHDIAAVPLQVSLERNHEIKIFRFFLWQEGALCK